MIPDAMPPATTDEPANPFDIGYDNPTDSEVAAEVGVELRELDAWLLVHVEFAKELARGRAKWGLDSSRDVAKQLLKAGTGYEGERLVKDKRTGAISRVTEFIEPNFKAMEKFLEVHDAGTYKDTTALRECVTRQDSLDVMCSLLGRGRNAVADRARLVPGSGYLFVTSEGTQPVPVTTDRRRRATVGGRHEAYWSQRQRATQ